MSFSNRRYEKGMDWMTFSLYLAMLAIGWLMIYTVGYGDGYGDTAMDIFSGTQVGKQSVWIALSLLIFFATQTIDWKFWRTFAYPIYIFAIFLLILVLIAGSTVKGATSWFTFGGFSFQPSELGKFGTCLALAAYLNNFNTDLKNTTNQLIAFGFMLLPMLLILLQPDAGSALVFLSFFIMLYREGLPSNYFVVGFIGAALLLLGLVFPPLHIITGLFLVAAFILALNIQKQTLYWTALILVAGAGAYWAIRNGYAWHTLGLSIALFLSYGIYHWTHRKERLVLLLAGSIFIGANMVYAANYFFNNLLKSHQRERINVWLRPDLCDPRGSLYNVLQSKMAIGSGGFQGKGFLEGTMTKLHYVPEQSTDFIFCTIGEEQGFLGSLSIIALFLLLLYRITLIAERQRSRFSRHYAYGVAGIFFIHIFINIGMTMGLMPIIGIPLPFISYGGSSLLGFTLMLGVLLRLDAHRGEP